MLLLWCSQWLHVYVPGTVKEMNTSNIFSSRMNLIKGKHSYFSVWVQEARDHCSLLSQIPTKPFLSQMTAAVTFHNTTPFKFLSLQMSCNALLLTAAWIWVQNGGPKFHSPWQYETGNPTPHGCKWSEVTHFLACLCITVSTKATNIHIAVIAIWAHHSEPKF